MWKCNITMFGLPRNYIFTIYRYVNDINIIINTDWYILLGLWRRNDVSGL